MIPSLLTLLTCQLFGETLARLTRLPIPGPVIGMALLFVFLVWRGEPPPALEETAGKLLSHLSLLFVPAGVGILLHEDAILAAWIPISVALLVSTLLTVAVTGWVMQRLTRVPGAGKTG